jgi:hypothetical protein
MIVNKKRVSSKNDDEKLNKINGSQCGKPVRDAGVAGSNPATPTKHFSRFF